jgi:hypothetical protein
MPKGFNNSRKMTKSKEPFGQELPNSHSQTLKSLLALADESQTKKEELILHP